MTPSIVDQVLKTKFTWDSILVNACKSYNKTPNLCNNLKYRGAFLAASVLATVEAVAYLAATILTGIAALFTCCKHSTNKDLFQTYLCRTVLNGLMIPTSLIGAIVHPKTAEKLAR